MAQTTSPDNIPSPSLSDPYALTQDMANLADATQNALIKRANAYTGTTAQRTAFTSTAPVGTIWSDTNGNRDVWKKGASTWELVNPLPETQTATSNFLSPILPYSPGNVVSYRRSGNVVTVIGVAGVSNASTIAGTTQAQASVVPSGFRPPATIYSGMNGSSTNTFMLIIAPGGELSIGRYSSNTGTNVWLPFHATYIV